MRQQRQQYTEWFARRRGPRKLREETALLAIADAFDAAMERGVLLKEELQTVIEGLRSPSNLLWSNACDLLMRLSGRWPEAAEAILRLMREPKAQVRFAALCSLGEQTPPEVIDQAIKSGLSDKSANVRWKAVDRANSLYRVNLVPEITAALATEKNKRSRRSMELDLRMLRDGHWLEPASPGKWKLTVRLSNGICSRIVNNEELESKGLKEIVLELRELRE